jgi:hypothetical protein
VRLAYTIAHGAAHGHLAVGLLVLPAGELEVHDGSVVLGPLEVPAGRRPDAAGEAADRGPRDAPARFERVDARPSSVASVS